jgi:DNA-binding transcriptional LysR family regulator
VRSAPELDDVALFVRVVDEGSFTRAARSVGVPTSTVSRTLTRLEEALGTRLLQRGSRKITLTEAGTVLLTEARAPLVAVREALVAASEEQRQPRGVLRLTAVADLSPLVATLVTTFTTRFPEVSVDAMLTSRTVDLVAEGVDVAIRAAKELRDSSMVARRIADLQAWLVASPDYLKRRGTPVAPDDLRDHDCVLFRARGGRARWPLRRDGTKVTVDVRGRVAGDDFGFVHGAVAEGAGIGLCPAFLCSDDVDDKILVRVLPTWTAGSGSLYLMYPGGKHLPSKVAAFRDHALEWCAKDPATSCEARSRASRRR